MKRLKYLMTEKFYFWVFKLEKDVFAQVNGAGFF